MILHAEHRLGKVPESRHRVVVHVPVGDLAIEAVERLGIDAKSVVLAGDFHLPREQVPHRLIRAAMAELELVGPGPHRQGQQLMAETNAKSRDFACQFSQGLDGRLDRFGIAGPVGDEQAIGGGLELADFGGRHIVRHHLHVAAHPAPDLMPLLVTTATRLQRLLTRRGIVDGGDTLDGWDPFADDAPRAWHARVRGFDLHAAVAVRAGARDRLERMCRYALRPAVGQERVRVSPEGQVVLDLRRRWADGTTHLVFDPVEFLERLAALAPRAAWREEVVPSLTTDSAVTDAVSTCSHSSRIGRRSNRAWAELMERSFPPSPRLRRASLKRFARKRVDGACVPTLRGADDAGGPDS